MNVCFTIEPWMEKTAAALLIVIVAPVLGYLIRGWVDELRSAGW